MRIALYARVSKTGDQTPENQLIELRRWAVLANHEVEGEYVDELSSKETRPQKEEVLKKLRLGTIDGVAFWSLDRWGRTISELVLEMEEFVRTNKIMISLREGLDLTSAAGRLQANILAAMANFERDRIRERTILGLQRVRAQGKKLGRPSKSGKIYKKPSRESVLECYNEGISSRDMAVKLETSRYWIRTVLDELRKDGKIEVNRK